MPGAPRDKRPVWLDGVRGGTCWEVGGRDVLSHGSGVVWILLSMHKVSPREGIWSLLTVFNGFIVL